MLFKRSLLAQAWNSADTLDRFYSFQEFYTDAQYGPDFGYYSTGRILHEDGLLDDGASEGEPAKQEWFNSYTTLPMALSPWFGALLADRIMSMWVAMGEPSLVFVVEFGGGTGVLARDFLRQVRKAHPGLYRAISRYVIGERSRALREAQRRTASEFVRSGKLLIVEADARQASRVRDYLETSDDHVCGFVVSNELLDEFDPLKLRLLWRAGQPPNVHQCAGCAAYRESYVFHRVSEVALKALLRAGATEGSDSESSGRLLEALQWESKTLPCGLLDTPCMRRLITDMVEHLTNEERLRCSPMQVCCMPFMLAADKLMQFGHVFPPPRWSPEVVQDMLASYRHHLQRTNGTITLAKDRYRQLRRLAARVGPRAERSLLVGGSGLPSGIESDEVFLVLSTQRCRELRRWRKRNAERLSVVAELRGAVAPLFDGLGRDSRTEHLKIVVRPGEAEFVREASRLVDEGFMVTVDYGADAQALAWQALVHPNFEGIYTMDARLEFAEECTKVSYLACPGLQDLTTSVDFTEVAEAGRQLGGWETKAYGPLLRLETPVFDNWLPEPLTHLLERAGGARTLGLHSWYRKAEGEPWASFKMLVQHRGGGPAENWTLSSPGLDWPLHAAAQLRAPLDPCWATDITKPPLAALIMDRTRSAEPGVSDMRALIDAFTYVLERRNLLDGWVEEYHRKQKQAYRDLHLALLLTDFWLHLVQEEGPGSCAPDLNPNIRAAWVDDIRAVAASRRLPDLHGEDMFEHVFSRLRETVFGNRTSPGPGEEPFVCAAAVVVESTCLSMGLAGGAGPAGEFAPRHVEN